MNQIQRLFVLAALVLITVSGEAQTNGSNSSYSRFGLGLLNDQSQGFNKGMGGVAQGFRINTQVNVQNPASYSCIDSLTFILDAGMGMQTGRMKQNGSNVRAMNTSLEYVTAGFRLRPGLGMSIGFVPYSTIGYNFDVANRIANNYTSSQTITTQTNYYGNGGLHQLYIGTGWNPFADLSIGANIGYLWGVYNHSMSQTFYEGTQTSSTYNAQNIMWSSDLRTFKLDIGVQYPITLKKDEKLTLGATMGLGHAINSKVNLLRFTSQGDTIPTNPVSKAFDLPYTISTGATWQHGERLAVGVDYTMEHWKGCRVPVSRATTTTNEIAISTDQYVNLHRIAAGADYIHSSATSKKYRDFIHYRFGMSYQTPYVKVNGHDGPSEMSLTAGVALPLKTSSRSLINVSAQWLRRSAGSKQITENYFMLHMGLTFNEQWFQKWKFQ